MSKIPARPGGDFFALHLDRKAKHQLKPPTHQNEERTRVSHVLPFLYYLCRGKFCSASGGTLLQFLPLEHEKGGLLRQAGQPTALMFPV